MGDRANVMLVYGGSYSPIYLYTHWCGTELPKTVQTALKRGKDRWDDDIYLGRIIFSEMVKDDIESNTGYGISPFVGDGDDHIVEVNLAQKRVRIERRGIDCTYEEFIKLDLDKQDEDDE